MERLFKRILPTIVAIGAGVLTLVGYLVPAPELTSMLVRWAAAIAAFALILGAFNLLRVHARRFLRGKSGWPYSVTLLLTALISFVVTTAGLIPGLVADPFNLSAHLLDSVSLFSDAWFSYVLLPLEAGTAGLIAFALTLAAFRLLRNRRRHIAETLVFLLFALVALLSMTPLPSPVGDVLGAFPMAGMRGFLIGVGLGTVLIGLRVLTGLDQPSSDA
ncbi:MAG: hypothetical protein PVI59_01490 [Anaerolineae bacterium]